MNKPYKRWTILYFIWSHYRSDSEQGTHKKTSGWSCLKVLWLCHIKKQSWSIMIKNGLKWFMDVRGSAVERLRTCRAHSNVKHTKWCSSSETTTRAGFKLPASMNPSGRQCMKHQSAESSELAAFHNVVRVSNGFTAPKMISIKLYALVTAG